MRSAILIAGAALLISACQDRAEPTTTGPGNEAAAAATPPEVAENMSDAADYAANSADAAAENSADASHDMSTHTPEDEEGTLIKKERPSDPPK